VYHRDDVRLPRLVALGALVSAACGDDPARITLAPVPGADPACGRPDDARRLLVTALGEFPQDVRAIDLGGVTSIADFPRDTRQIEVSVEGPSGVIRTFGRTAPLDLTALDDGDVVPIFMAAPDSGCPVAALATPRDRPLVVAAGDGALVIGGRGQGGALLGSAEWYDPARGRFEPVAVPSALDGPRGAAGMAAATLPDGRVVLTGGDRPIYVVFDPETRGFAAPGALFPARAHHVAVAIGGTRVLLAGGCERVDDAGGCAAGTERTDTVVLDVADGAIVAGPPLAAARVGAAAVREPDLGDGARVLVVGGGAAGAERVDPLAAQPGAIVAGASGAVAALASGSAVAGFDGGVAVIVPGVATARPQPGARRTEPTVTTLEDGDALVLGGDAAPARYRPGDGAVVALAGAPVARTGHGAARLPDGTVVVAGGRDDGGEPVGDAWVFRPAGDGPFTGAVTVTPGGTTEVPLVPLDPARIDRAPAYVIEGGWAVIGGMRPRELDLTATVDAGDGVTILVGLVDPERYDALALVPGAPARLARADGGAGCSGSPVPRLDGATAVDVSIRRGEVRVAVAGAAVLACPLEPRAGLVGIAAPAGPVTLSTISVTR
jgi:hypothetical protein